jgi:hypothetical protein
MSDNGNAAARMTVEEFLRQAQSCKTINEYLALYNSVSSDFRSAVIAYSDDLKNIFIQWPEGQDGESLSFKNDADGRASLYAAADKAGINLNGMIPDPESLYRMNTDDGVKPSDYIGKLLLDLSSYESPQWQRSQESVEETEFSGLDSDESSVFEPEQDDFRRLTAEFIASPYREDNNGVRGSLLPDFGRFSADGEYSLYKGWHLSSLYALWGPESSQKDPSCVTLRKGKEILVIPRLDYDNMTTALKSFSASLSVASEGTDKEAAEQKLADSMLSDYAETRTNTAANFWHNFSALVVSQADNPEEAALVAESIVSEMAVEEKNRFLSMKQAYERATGKSFESRIAEKYYEAGRTKKISSILLSREDGVLSSIADVTDSVSSKGSRISEFSMLAVGDTVRMPVHFTAAFGGKSKGLSLDSGELEITCASRINNRVVLVSSDRTSRYEMPLDEFISSQKKLEEEHSKAAEKASLLKKKAARKEKSKAGRAGDILPGERKKDSLLRTEQKYDALLLGRSLSVKDYVRAYNRFLPNKNCYFAANYFLACSRSSSLQEALRAAKSLYSLMGPVEKAAYNRAAELYKSRHGGRTFESSLKLQYYSCAREQRKSSFGWQTAEDSYSDRDTLVRKGRISPSSSLEAGSVVMLRLPCLRAGVIKILGGEVKPFLIEAADRENNSVYLTTAGGEKKIKMPLDEFIAVSRKQTKAVSRILTKADDVLEKAYVRHPAVSRSADLSYRKR